MLAGQSNMAGRGRLDATPRPPDPHIVCLNRQGRWQPAVDPLHFDKPQLAGVGPGLAFARAVNEAAASQQQRQQQRIGLVPCAVGGSALAHWQPGAPHPDTDSRPLDDTLVRMALAGPAGRWCGLLWHQGESDCNERAAPLYASRLLQLMERLRSAAGNPLLPLVIGQMGRWPERPWHHWHLLVDDAHRQVARALPNAAFVTSDGLSHTGDGLHFDAASARLLGQRYAHAFLSLSRTTA